MGLFSCFRKVHHLGFVLSGDSLLRLRGDLSSTPADDIVLPQVTPIDDIERRLRSAASNGDIGLQREISAIAALSPRKIVVVCGSDIFLCSKKKIVKIYEGGTIKPLIGCCGIRFPHNRRFVVEPLGNDRSYSYLEEEAGR